MKLILQSIKIEAHEVETFVFKPTESLMYQAGQFLHYVLHHEPTDDRGSDRWFTNSAAPFEGATQITTRFSSEKSSSFKTALRELKIGDEIEISDVDGDFVVDDLNKDYVFIAGGIGITPFRSILKQLTHEGKMFKATLLYSNRNENIPFKEELDDIAKNNSSFKIHYIISPEHINEAKIKELVPDIKKTTFYLSGPEPMVEALGETLKGMNIAKNQIKQDFFPNYPEE